ANKDCSTPPMMTMVLSSINKALVAVCSTQRTMTTSLRSSRWTMTSKDNHNNSISRRVNALVALATTA
ncbi:hypothetical protein GGH92_007296, partial [Coemansia sp. RSA 2673]